jgi:phage terminase large subunit
MSKKNVEELLNILKGSDKFNLGSVNPEEISEEYNKRLVFEPGECI